MLVVQLIDPVTSVYFVRIKMYGGREGNFSKLYHFQFFIIVIIKINNIHVATKEINKETTLSKRTVRKGS